MTERRASIPTCRNRPERTAERTASVTPPPAPRPLPPRAPPLRLALERAAGLLQKHVVERGRVQLKRLHRDALGVEGANDLGQLGVAARESHGGALRGGRRRFAEAGQHVFHSREIPGLGGNHLDAGAADLGLQRLRGSLGHDPAMVDDAHAVGEHVCLLQILRGQEDRDATIAGQTLHLLPQRGAALHVEAGSGLIEEQDPRPVDQRERQVEPALHATRVAAHPAVGGLRESHPLEQGRGALAPVSPAHAVQRGLQLHVLACRSRTGPAPPPGARRRSTPAPPSRPPQRRGRPRAPCPRWAAAAW